MEPIEITSELRTTRGKGPARVLRREGRIPAILYGSEVQPEMLSIDRKEFETLLKINPAGQALVNLVIQGSDQKNYPVMIKEIQRHPVSRKPLHVDFYQVSMDRKIKVMVPVEAVGKSIGVEMGGMLQIIRREVEVLCFPNRIPEKITIDTTDMNIGDSIHVDEIQFEGEVEVPPGANFTILTILGKKAEEEEEEVMEGEEAGEEAEAEAEAAE